jgi:hypothetical protein
MAFRKVVGSRSFCAFLLLFIFDVLAQIYLNVSMAREC